VKKTCDRWVTFEGQARLDDFWTAAHYTTDLLAEFIPRHTLAIQTRFLEEVAKGQASAAVADPRSRFFDGAPLIQPIPVPTEFDVEKVLLSLPLLLPLAVSLPQPRLDLPQSLLVLLRHTPIHPVSAVPLL
jgi:hypothetical protein